MEWLFKPGDKVKIGPLSIIQKDHEFGKKHLGPFLKTIEEKWYKPTEENYEKLKQLIFTVDSEVMHQMMGSCYWLIESITGNQYRYPEGWLEKYE